MALDLLNSADHETAINSLRWTWCHTDVWRLWSFSLFHSAPLGILQRIAKRGVRETAGKWVQGYESMSGLRCVKSGGNCIVPQCIGSCETSAKHKGAPESMASRWSCSGRYVSFESKGFSTCCMRADVCQPAWLHQPRKWNWSSKHVHHAALLADVWAPSSKNVSCDRKQQVVQASEWRGGGFGWEREGTRNDQPGWTETDMGEGSAVVGRTLHKCKRDGGEREGVR